MSMELLKFAGTDVDSQPWDVVVLEAALRAWPPRSPLMIAALNAFSS